MHPKIVKIEEKKSYYEYFLNLRPDVFEGRKEREEIFEKKYPHLFFLISIMTLLIYTLYTLLGTYIKHMIFIFQNSKYHIILVFWEIQVFVDLAYFGWVSYLDIFNVVDIYIQIILELQGNICEMKQ
jgi:hypothetical protein